MRAKISRVLETLREGLSPAVVDELGLQVGQSERMRVVTPFRLLMALTAAFAGGGCESIADVLREFNLQQGTTTHYKAFYNRVSRPSFPLFMRALVCRLLGNLAMRTLQPAVGGPLSAFSDIVIQDGSSFAVKDDLEPIFPGRFKKNGPAAVELHATFSGFDDEVIAVSLAPDKEAERPFLPAPSELEGKLLLADRGYPSLPYFRAVDAHGGYFIIRISTSFNPRVVAEWRNGRRRVFRNPERLSSLIGKHHRGRPREFEVKFAEADEEEPFRVIVFEGKEKPGTRLATNLPRAPFDEGLIGKLYRLRWQVELVFKEWKSYANLRAFDTSNPGIVEGFIWTSVLVAILKRFFAHATQAVHDVPMSTRRVAMCVAPLVRDLCDALAKGPSQLTRTVTFILSYLAANAQRAHPARDQTSGRLAAGLELAL